MTWHRHCIGIGASGKGTRQLSCRQPATKGGQLHSVGDGSGRRGARGYLVANELADVGGAGVGDGNDLDQLGVFNRARLLGREGSP